MHFHVLPLYVWGWSVAHAASVGQKALLGPPTPSSDTSGLQSGHQGRKLQGKFLHFTGRLAPTISSSIYHEKHSDPP